MNTGRDNVTYRDGSAGDNVSDESGSRRIRRWFIVAFDTEDGRVPKDFTFRLGDVPIELCDGTNVQVYSTLDPDEAKPCPTCHQPLPGLEAAR